MNKEKEFEWTDELVKEFAYSYANNEFINLGIGISKIESFKKLKEEVKPVVVGIEFWINRIRFVFGEGFPEISISKERLAEILIAEQKGMLNIIEPISSEDVKEYTGKEYLQFGEDCFTNGRLSNALVGWKYDTFSDYMNDKQKPK